MNCIWGAYGTFIWLQKQVVGYIGLKSRTSFEDFEHTVGN